MAHRITGCRDILTLEFRLIKSKLFVLSGKTLSIPQITPFNPQENRAEPEGFLSSPHRGSVSIRTSRTFALREAFLSFSSNDKCQWTEPSS